MKSASKSARVVAGTVVTSPAPLPIQCNAQRALGRFIGGPFQDDDGRGGPGGWWIFPEVDVRFGPHDILRPDMSGWRRERLADPWYARPIDVVPDWICEILSPSNARHDRVTKRRLYAAHGVAHYWIVDVEQRLLEAHRLGDEGDWIVVGVYGDESAAIPPFEAVDLAVSRLFPPLRPPLPPARSDE